MTTGGPSLGEAIGLQAKVADRTNLIVGEIGRQRKEEEAIVSANKKAATKNLDDIEKYKNDLGKWQISAESGIHPVYHEKLAAMAEQMRQRFQKGQENDKENYSPAYDSELQRMKFEFQQEADKDKQSTKNIVRDLGVKASDSKNKYDVNEPLLNSLNVRSYDDFIKSNGGSDYYAIGINTPKPAVLGWTKDAALWASKMKGLYVKNADGSKTINPKLFEEQWNAIKNDPAATWVENADAVNKAAGYSPEQSEAQVKSYVMNLLPNQAAPDKSTGAGTGSKAKYDFSSPTTFKHSLSGGDVEDVTQVTLTKKGGGSLPADSYTNEKGQVLLGRPTGRISKYGKSDEVKIELAVPNKSLTTSPEWKDMDEEERQTWLDRKFDEDPNKFEKVTVPISSNQFNKDKFEGSYGKTVEDLFGQNKSKTKSTATTDDKVVVEKDGKKFRLPKGQLAEAQKQGYKLSK